MLNLAILMPLINIIFLLQIYIKMSTNWDLNFHKIINQNNLIDPLGFNIQVMEVIVLIYLVS